MSLTGCDAAPACRLDTGVRDCFEAIEGGLLDLEGVLEFFDHL